VQSSGNCVALVGVGVVVVVVFAVVTVRVAKCEQSCVVNLVDLEALVTNV